jgi:hypothetical protein
MDLWIGIFIWLCGVVMGFAAAIIMMSRVKDEADDEEAREQS